MNISRAEHRDIASILDLVKECIANMNASGIFQWNEEYPLPEIFVTDVESGVLYALREDEKIIGIIVLTDVQDEQYKDIQWSDDRGKYIVIHRLAVHPKWQRKGIGSSLMDFAEDIARKSGHTSIRVDTFSENPRSLRFFEKMGYERKPGEIFFPENKEPYYCYERILE